MEKYFNVAGPCFPDEHYMLPALERLPGIMRTVERRGYFVLHAARQSGKTTALMALVEEINGRGVMNALARECVMNIHGCRYDEPITAEDVATAKESIIRARGTHIDSLMERLKEPRVRRVVEPVILGKDAFLSEFDDDYRCSTRTSRSRGTRNSTPATKRSKARRST